MGLILAKRLTHLGRVSHFVFSIFWREFDSVGFKQSMPMHKVIVAGVYIEKENRVLMVQEKGQALGLWSLPMGHLDENESIEDGARREAKEETGYDVQIKSKIGVSTIPGSEYKGGEKDNKKKIEFHIFKAEVIGGELSRGEKDLLDVKWIPKESVGKLPLRGEWLKTYLYGV